jgi:hypothetical protein
VWEVGGRRRMNDDPSRWNHVFLNELVVGRVSSSFEEGKAAEMRPRNPCTINKSSSLLPTCRRVCAGDESNAHSASIPYTTVPTHPPTSPGQFRTLA